jgi:RNA polymerase sigma factor (sigma-70 family)
MSSMNNVLDLPAATTSSTTTELFAAILDGDDAAWRLTVERYQGLLLWVARRYRLTGEETADVVQETWTRLLEHLGNIRNPEHIGGWLATTTARQSLAVLRQRRRESPAPDGVVDTTETWDVDDQLDAVQRAVELRRAVATLSPRERDLIEVLLEPEPPSYAEISRRLSMPLGSIGPVRGRALRRLRTLLPQAMAPQADLLSA